jgi:hypothetical protein
MSRKWLVLILAAVLLVSSAVSLNINPAEPVRLTADMLPGGLDNFFHGSLSGTSGNGKLRLTLSETGHFFEQDVEVSLTASVPNAKIYYTTDGSEPASTSEEYSGPLTFRAEEGMNVVTLKAVAVYGNTVTRPLAHTFFIGEGVHDRFDTLVFSLSTDPAHLYDYYTGIFVAGWLRDDYIAKNPDETIGPFSPAGYNLRGRESERPVYVETFTPDGERVLAQAAGLRVHGGWTRSREQQKSLRLVARREYEPGAGKFHFDFFPDNTLANGYGAPLTKYDQIVLRNGGDDRECGLIRNEVGSVLASRAGFYAVTPARAAAVFLNGEYYGFVWVNVRINGQYLQDMYSAPAADFQIVGTGERRIETDDEDEQKAIAHLIGYANKDLRDDTIFAELEELMDIDDFLLYYAFQAYMGNEDWPNYNNFKRWRYTGPQTKGLAPELDGRWRHVLFDFDRTLGLYDNPPDVPTLHQLLDKGDHFMYSHMLAAVLAREDMADRFSMIMCGLAANVVTAQSVTDLIDRLYGEARGEIGAALDAGKCHPYVSWERIARHHTEMIRFAAGREDYMFAALREHFGYGGDMFAVEVTGAPAFIGLQRGTSARYFDRLTVPLRPDLPKFTAFDHWVVNGEKIYKPEITVSAADARNGTVKAELVTKETIPPLVFTNAYALPGRNGCILRNPTGEAVRTAGLYLTDNPADPFLWAFPNARIAPGGTIALVGRNGAGFEDLMKIQMGFNVRKGRMLYLSDGTGTILDTIVVP